MTEIRNILYKVTNLDWTVENRIKNIDEFIRQINSQLAQFYNQNLEEVENLVHIYPQFSELRAELVNKLKLLEKLKSMFIELRDTWR